MNNVHATLRHNTVPYTRNANETTIHLRYLIRYALGECECVLVNFRFLWFLLTVYFTLTIDFVSCKTADEHTFYKKHSFPIFFLPPVAFDKYYFTYRVFGVFRKCTFIIIWLLEKVEVLLFFFAQLHLISCI